MVWCPRPCPRRLLKPSHHADPAFNPCATLPLRRLGRVGDGGGRAEAPASRNHHRVGRVSARSSRSGLSRSAMKSTAIFTSAFSLYTSSLRHAAPHPPRPRLQGRIVKSRFPESQRDSILQPRVDRAAGYPGSSCRNIINPERVASSAPPFDATPLGLKTISESAPRVARSSQPWANGRCPVGANPSPPLAEQRRILSGLDALQAEVDALKTLQAEAAAELPPHENNVPGDF